ncbi:alpha/beta hydrolase [Aspergillus neoniger CBS 115656]|uniref:Alpha/beta-hydrolase n=1 Tax=Aspergillus neoniger (strain CBS 115656) TaxID=1448310 RepID=A0A318Y3I7_ASPNB|nr:alpha/beta-hydrolase [Aspergillus neoniger CBS 115656]PYH28359.1 alpha/beta-hydrolase [Aspergillus neoniger CBS 115656]
MSSSSTFRVIEHTVPCQHIREYPAATRKTQEDVLHLAVKQYIPTNDPTPLPRAVTILIAPGSGFAKELYEPLCEELLVRCNRDGLSIRSIWAADPAHQGQSSIVNEGLLGIDVSHFDHSRDLLHLINVKRDEMPHPIIAIAHSAGAFALVNLCLIHPRLFQAVVLIEPPITRPVTRLRNKKLYNHSTLLRPHLQFSVHRRENWPSREAAAESFRRKAFYQTWDPRAFERLVTYGLRNDSRKSSAHEKNNQSTRPTAVTLSTPLAQELASFGRPYHDLPAPDAGPNDIRNRLTHPDLDPELLTSIPFYRPEITALFSRLPYLRPSVLYIFGSESHISLPELRSDKLQVTGVATGGSGGAVPGRVREVVMKGYSHQVTFEAVNECADEIARWLVCESRRWCKEVKACHERWDGLPGAVDNTTVEKRWKVHIPKAHRIKSNL